MTLNIPATRADTRGLQLYGAQTGNCWRAAISLEEAQIPYTPRWVDLRAREQSSKKFLELNPLGKVPVLTNEASSDGFVLTQSNAIVFYAAQQAPQRLLHARDAQALALINERYFYFLTDVISLNHAAFFLGGRTDPSSSAILTARMLEALVISERFLADDAYMAGDHFSIADIAAVTITSSVAKHLDWSRLPNLKRWFFEVMARPSVVRGMSVFAQTNTPAR